ncbi:MAG: heme exporter protein CcmD [Thalassotalea sp.]
MQFTNLNDFITMGNHGFYVWLSFGLTFLLLAALVWSSKAQNKQIKLAILKRQQREQKLKKAAQQQQSSAETISINESVNESKEVINESTS